MVGGVVTSVLMELLVYPAIYFLWKKRSIDSQENKVTTISSSMIKNDTMTNYSQN